MAAVKEAAVKAAAKAAGANLTKWVSVACAVVCGSVLIVGWSAFRAGQEKGRAVRPAPSASLVHEILERPTILPSVGMKVPSVRGENSTAAEVFRQDDQRGVGEIHREIAVLLHQLEDARKVPAVQREDLEGALGGAGDERLGSRRSKPRDHEMARFRQDGPGRDQSVFQTSQRTLGCEMVFVAGIGERQKESRIGDNHPRDFRASECVSWSLYVSDRSGGPAAQPTSEARAAAGLPRVTVW